MRNKKILGALLAVTTLATFGLAGCGNSGSNGAASKEDDKTITLADLDNGPAKTSDTFDRVCVDLGLMPKDPEERANMDRRKRVWFHTLRHTFASWLAQSGKVTLYELRDLLRHSSITQTERYAHLIPSTVQKKAAMIDEILEGQNEEGPAHD